MSNQTSDKEIEKLLKDYPRLAHEQAELKQAIAILLVKARLDEQQRTFIGCTKPTIEIWFEKDGSGHPSITKDDRIVELQAQLTPKEKSGE